MRLEARVCSGCGYAALPDARFCPQCGQALEGTSDESRRLYGVVPPGPAVVLGCVLLLGAVLVLLAGHAITAIVLLGLSGLAFVLFYEAVKRDPTSPLARRATTSSDRVRGWVAFARASISAWAVAIREVVRLRRESRSLRREREQALRALGDAAYREDETAASTLRRRLHEIDAGIANREEARAEVLARARRVVEEEHAAARPTEQHAVDELTSGEDAED